MSTENQQQQPDTSKDEAGVVIMTVIRITDPETGEVLLQQRGDE